MTRLAYYGIVTLGLLLLSSAALGQRVTTDSLIQRLAVADDSTRVRTLHTLMWRLLYKDSQQALDHAKEALELSQAMRWLQAEVQSLNNLGVAYSVQGNFEESIRSFFSVLDLNERIEDSTQIAFAFKGLGNNYQLLEDYEKAIENFKHSLAIYELAGTPGNINGAMNNVGLVYKAYGVADSAIVYFKKRLRHSEEHGERFRPAVSSSLNNLAGVYKDAGEYDQARVYYERSLAIKRELEDQRGEALVLGNIGELYAKQGLYEIGIANLLQSIEMREKIGDRRGQALNLNRVASIYSSLGDHGSAARLSNSSYVIAKELGNVDLEKTALFTLKESYEGLGQFKKAYETQELYAELKDSLFNAEKSKQIAEMQARFDLDLKQQEIEAQDQQIVLLEQKNAAETRLRWILMVSAALLVLLAGILFNRYKLKQRANAMLSNKNIEIEEKNAEIRVINKELEKKMLRAQMDPHFIFNSLNSIQHFITANDKTSALKYLSKFAKLVRQVLDSSVSDRVSLEQEISLLDAYIQLEQMRLNHTFDHSIKVDPAIDIHNTEIPFLILQPYVENAIKHGLKNKAGPGQLDVAITRANGYLNCVIEDNGIGRERARQLRPDTHKSHGLSVTARRLQLLNKHSSEKTTVQIADLMGTGGEPAGTRVEISIPVG